MSVCVCATICRTVSIKDAFITFNVQAMLVGTYRTKNAYSYIQCANAAAAPQVLHYITRMTLPLVECKALIQTDPSVVAKCWPKRAVLRTLVASGHNPYHSHPSTTKDFIAVLQHLASTSSSVCFTAVEDLRLQVSSTSVRAMVCISPASSFSDNNGMHIRSGAQLSIVAYFLGCTGLVKFSSLVLLNC